MRFRPQRRAASRVSSDAWKRHFLRVNKEGIRHCKNRQVQALLIKHFCKAINLALSVSEKVLRGRMMWIVEVRNHYYSTKTVWDYLIIIKKVYFRMKYTLYNVISCKLLHSLIVGEELVATNFCGVYWKPIVSCLLLWLSLICFSGFRSASSRHVRVSGFAGEAPVRRHQRHEAVGRGLARPPHPHAGTATFR
jgi:hypothetical protein